MPENATDKRITFTSSNPSCVSIDSNGRIFGVSSGTSTITAKASNNIASSITVRVYSKVTGLELNEEELCLQIDENYTIKPTILPEDATNNKLTFSSSNTNIATIDENGNIKALQEGTCQIKVNTNEGNYEKTVELTVIPKLEEGAINFDESLTIIGNQITGIKEKTTVDELLTKIESKYEIQVQNANGTIIQGKEFVGTQSTIIVKSEDKIIIKYNLILYGDVNGDGRISSVDLLVLQRHILEIKPLTGLFLKAANTDKSIKRPSSVDLLRIQRHILQIQELPVSH